MFKTFPSPNAGQWKFFQWEEYSIFLEQSLICSRPKVIHAICQSVMRIRHPGQEMQLSKRCIPLEYQIRNFKFNHHYTFFVLHALTH